MEESDVTELRDSILQAMQEANDSVNRQYKFSVSIGYSEFKEDITSARQLVAQADKDLYLVKQKRKNEK